MKIIESKKGYYEFEHNDNLFIIQKSEESQEWEFSVMDKEAGFYERLENCHTLKEAKNCILKWD